MPHALTAENLGVKIDRSENAWRIRNVSLHIESGTFTGIIGQSGAGKSTLLRALSIHLLKSGDEGALYLHHGSGRFHIDGDTQNAYLDQLAYVPQEDHFADSLTVQETLRLAAIFSAGSQLPAELIAKVGLPEDTLEKPVSVLSGGQKRRLSIARALAENPRFLFLDEPTSGLDLPLAQDIMATLAELGRSEKITILCTSHLPATLKHCHRVLVMAPGENHAGGCIIADLDRAAFLSALDSDPDATSLYQSNPPTQSDLPPPPESLPEAEIPILQTTSGQSFPAHFRAVFHRAFTVWSRDRTNRWVFCFQPIVLATIIVLTQSLHRQHAAEFIDFFLTVAALWIGMSLCIRDFVSERTLYALDELSGLDPPAYFWAKLTFASALTLTGIGILTLVAHLLVSVADSAFDLEHARFRFTLWHLMPRLIILGVTGLSGTMIGLFLSLVFKSERAAISTMPLTLLPQVVFSSYACGFATIKDAESTFPFHALLQNQTDSSAGIDWLNYLPGLFMTTRHANWSLRGLTTNGFEWSKFHWPDFGALWLVFALLFALVCLAFFATANRAILRIR